MAFFPGLWALWPCTAHCWRSLQELLKPSAAIMAQWLLLGQPNKRHEPQGLNSKHEPSSMPPGQSKQNLSHQWLNLRLEPPRARQEKPPRAKQKKDPSHQGLNTAQEPHGLATSKCNTYLHKRHKLYMCFEHNFTQDPSKEANLASH